MKRFTRPLVLLALSACVLLPAAPAGEAQKRRPTRARQRPAASSVSADARREEAYRANNLGVALLEQFKYKEGAEAFRRALSIEPGLALAHVNLAVALYNVPEPEEAEREARAAADASPEAPQPHYLLGLIAKSQNRPEEAAAAFKRVLAFDPYDVGANVSLGQVYAQQRRYEEAVALFRAALAAEPYNGTALYNLGTALLRVGAREEGQRRIAEFQELRQRGSGTTIGQNYMEQGRYAEAVASTGAEANLVDARTPPVVFTDATRAAFASSASARAWPARSARDVKREPESGAVLLFDYDADGWLDLLEVAGGAQRLYHNEGGRFVDATARSGALAATASGAGTGAVAGDFDNDGRADIFVLREGASALYRNEGGGRFADVTAAAKIPAYTPLARSAAVVDCDHDGDLDLFVGGGWEPMGAAGGAAVSPQPSRDKNDPALSFHAPALGLLLRNNGDGTFTDQTEASKLSGARGVVAVVPTDFDNRRDVDLLVATSEGAQLWRNMRDGTFQDVAKEVGLGDSRLMPSLAGVAAGDVNKDGFTDFYFGVGPTSTFALGVEYFALSDGRGRFRLERGPSGSGARPGEFGYRSVSQFIDYDSDGLLDLVSVVTRPGARGAGPRATTLRVWRNTGGGWADVSATAARGLEPLTGGGAAQAVLASGDLDGDGDTDIVYGVPGGGLRLARNDGGNRNRSLRVRLAGKVSNRSGVGAKVELRAGSLRQRLETYSASPAPAPADALFGLGRRVRADAVRILWPSGVVQAETELAGDALDPAGRGATAVTLPVTELDRKPSSCPYLYAWDGERFSFVTDFMGGGEMGYLEEPGRYNRPDPVEYVRIRGDQLKERAGRYELRVTNELEEALFADRFQLVAVAHPRGTEVYPNEGMTDPPKPFALYKARGARTPLAATDEHGHDVLARVERMDRLYPEDFRRDALRGYAEEHTLTLKLDEDGSERPRTLLLLTGWTDYAWSSDNVAAVQAGKGMKLPALQVKDGAGRWRTVVEDIGIPVGRPQTVTVDLTGKFLSASREVRVVTNMRILWDQVLVDTSAGDFETRTTTLDPASATLRWRGFSRETTPDGREPYGYDYQRVSFVSPWKALPGRYTREGDVRDLLLAADDMFVVSRPGDEISLSFDATALPPLPAGWTRTFLLYSDGYSKEMDINSASPDQLSPFPFHAMTRYPYPAPETYPRTDAHRAYLERYNTRLVTAELPSLDALLLLAARSPTPPRR
ncbi:MAG TPA: FG-GAP-like repeat-containing protein [Pyrinomonadaceae bacterium]|jgi:tetratricopeptide (TPR) repeat protein